MGIFVAGIAANSVVDGPGLRTVIWFQGCSIRCAGCQNKALWPHGTGPAMATTEMAQTLVGLNERHTGGNGKFTITGGEPFDQAEGLDALLTAIHRERPDAHIIVYTGSTWTDLQDRFGEAQSLLLDILSKIDILVDGPYIPELDSDKMQYVGSSNQRAIRVQDTLVAGAIVKEDWALNAMFTIVDGRLTTAMGWLDELDLDAMGVLVDAPRCGQADRKEE